MCRCVWLCVFVWCCVVCCCCVCGAWCGTLKTPCVDSKRLHVYIRNVPVYADNTHTCFSTCVHGAGTHKDVLNVHTKAFLNLHTVVVAKNHARRVLTCPRGSPRGSPSNSWISTILRIDLEQHVPDSASHSLHLTKLLRSSCPGETLEGTSREMVRFVFRSREQSITNDLRVSIS